MIFILALSFLNLTFVSGILDDISQTAIDEVIDTETAHVVINPQEEPEVEEYISGQRELRRQIERIPGVEATARHYELAGSLAYDQNKTGQFKRVSAQMIAVDPVQERNVLTTADRLVDGEYLDELATDEIILGIDLVEGYGGGTDRNLGPVKIGDEVEIAFANGVIRNFKVTGFYKLGFFSGLAFISAKEAESVLGINDSANLILARVDLKRDNLDNYHDQIQKIAPNLNVKKYTDVLGDEAAIGDLFNTISAIMSTISIAVAAVSVFILIYINAIHKQRQIGILQAIGIKQSILIHNYVLQSFFLAMCGIVVGSFLVFLVLHPLLNAYPIQTPMGDISLTFSTFKILVSVASFLLAAMIAGLIPSRKVARQNILKAIWGV